jgi:hypothetical protein
MIYTCNLVVNGWLSNIPSIYTNNMASMSNTNIRFNSDLDVSGSVLSTGKVFGGVSIFATFALNSNIGFSNWGMAAPGGGGGWEVYGSSNVFGMSPLVSDMSGMTGMSMSVPLQQVYSASNGYITVPVSGIYSLMTQGRFVGGDAATVKGVYYNFLREANSNARIGANFITGNVPLVSSSVTRFLLGGDKVRPIFYSSDSNVVLSAGPESFIHFTILAPVHPTHMNYYRV